MNGHSEILSRLEKSDVAEMYRMSGNPRVAEFARHYRERLVGELPALELLELSRLPNSVRRAKITGWIDVMVDQEDQLFSDAEYLEMIDVIQYEMMGIGPLQPLLMDDSISEIMVNWIQGDAESQDGKARIYIERDGKLIRAPMQIQFRNVAHLKHVIDRIVSPLGRRVDESSPYVDARLPEGHRVNAIISPLATDGPALTIRKFREAPFTEEDLLKHESLTPDMLLFLKACVKARLNLLLSGSTSSGKTTALNVFSTFIPEKERIVTIEDSAELRFHENHPHVIRLETRTANVEGRGEVTIRHLIRNSLRMRPDRLVIGEVRGGEAIDMLQAMNTGHEGSMTTLHANTPADAFSRLENMVFSSESARQLGVQQVREQMVSAIDIVVQLSRLRGGKRRMVSISEVQELRHGEVVLKELFHFQQTGISKAGHAQGHFSATGVVPRSLSLLESRLSSEEADRLRDVFSLNYFHRELGAKIMDNKHINEIIINRPDEIYIERKGKLIKLTPSQVKAAGGIGFRNSRHVLEIVSKIAARMGRRLNQQITTLDARLPDGSRVNVLMPPVVLNRNDANADKTLPCPAVTIRRFPVRMALADLQKRGAMSVPMLAFLTACIRARLNVLVSGGTGSGKTTLLNALSGCIPNHERIITVEDVAELQLRQPHWIRTETQQADQFGEGEVTIRDLVRNSLRMRPDRIVIGECRGTEALDMLQAMNTGHAGSMTTVHSNSPREAFVRLTTMVRMNPEAHTMNPEEINAQMGVVDLVVQTNRLSDGTRKIVQIAEVSDQLEIRPIFQFVPTGINQTSPRQWVQGSFEPIFPPNALERLQAVSDFVTPTLFEADQAVSIEGETFTS